MVNQILIDYCVVKMYKKKKIIKIGYMVTVLVEKLGRYSTIEII